MFRPDWETGENDENEADGVLRQGLRLLPVPEPSLDFDARVHAALRRPTPWWKTVWTAARPVLATAACSLLVTLAILKGLSSSPTNTLQPGNRTEIAAHRKAERMTALESDDPSSLSVNGFASLHGRYRLK